jgi:hypothetical protein
MNRKFTMGKLKSSVATSAGGLFVTDIAYYRGFTIKTKRN